jgi:predicted glutamine amidotransferase
MCRFAAYLGEPIPIESVLYEPDRALVRQAVDSELMTHLNLGGFGLAAWNDAAPDPGTPLTYRVPTLPSFDRNLRALARNIRARALIAHVRGVVYDSRERVGAHNVHPFLFDGRESVTCRARGPEAICARAPAQPSLLPPFPRRRSGTRRDRRCGPLRATARLRGVDPR